MKPVIKWDEIDPCLTCYAMVPRQVMHAHTQWHDNIASEAIRSARRLDHIEASQVADRSADNLKMIRVQGDPDGALELDCLHDDGRCRWAWYETQQEAPWQGYTLADLILVAATHQHQTVIDGETTPVCERCRCEIGRRDDDCPDSCPCHLEPLVTGSMASDQAGPAGKPNPPEVPDA